MPEAAPRYLAGTLLMIDAELGAANMPPPMPFARPRRAKAQYGKSTGRNMSPTKLAPKTTIPAVENTRAPNLSESAPDTGPDIRIPAVSGSRKMPAHRGVSL